MGHLAWAAELIRRARAEGRRVARSLTTQFVVGAVGESDLYAELQPLGVLHSNGQLADQPWGTREFGVLDSDGNLITFFERV